MSRVMITAPVVVPVMGPLKKGDVIEATAAQLTAITTAGGSTRAVSTSNMKDVLGESVGVANGDGLVCTPPNMTL